MSSRKRTRTLTGKDADDWKRVTESVTPLRNGPPGNIAIEPMETGQLKPEPAASGNAGIAKASKQKPPVQYTPRPPSPPNAQSRHSQPAFKLDQAYARRLRRGQELDARIDLHGLRQSDAHRQLLAFVKMARARGHRLVLVITGKGKRADGSDDWWNGEARGVLRRSVPDWLSAPEFRDHVAAFRSAGRTHGGEGAYYVQLRRLRDSRI